MRNNMKALAMALGLTILGSTTSVYASPGNLDKNGGHHCWTSCSKYGLETGEYHYHNNWKQENGKWYFYDQQGMKAKGWKNITGTWYYFDNKGVMQTGWKLIGGVWYYFDASGGMQTDWELINGTWYYFDRSGAMQTDWQVINGTWYYFNGSGAMQIGWQVINGTWYYFNESGEMKTGWQAINGAWYYFNTSGAMQTGWIQDNGQWYFLEDDGAWNSIVQYEGYWTNVKIPDTDDLQKIPAHMSARIEKLSGNRVSVGVAYASARITHYADAGGEVILQNNKAVLHFDEDGWGNKGTAVFELKDGAVYVDISLYGEKHQYGFGLPEGKHKLIYHSNVE